MRFPRVNCQIVEVPRSPWIRSGRVIESAREVRPQSDPCIARIVAIVARRGRLMGTKLDDACPRQTLIAEAPAPLKEWFPGLDHPSHRDVPRAPEKHENT